MCGLWAPNTQQICYPDAYRQEREGIRNLPQPGICVEYEAIELSKFLGVQWWMIMNFQGTHGNLKFARQPMHPQPRLMVPLTSQSEPGLASPGKILMRCNRTRAAL